MQKVNTKHTNQLKPKAKTRHKVLEVLFGNKEEISSLMKMETLFTEKSFKHPMISFGVGVLSHLCAERCVRVLLLEFETSWVLPRYGYKEHKSQKNNVSLSVF